MSIKQVFTNTDTVPDHYRENGVASVNVAASKTVDLLKLRYAFAQKLPSTTNAIQVQSISLKGDGSKEVTARGLQTENEVNVLAF